MTIRKQHRTLFLLPKTHPARAFLEDFIDCKNECVGRDVGGPEDPGIDQAWFSYSDGKQWSFSDFAYKYLSFDVELDGWLTNAPELTESERHYLNWLPALRTLLDECDAQAKVDGNHAILPLVSRARGLLDRWETCIVSRLEHRDA